MNRASWLNYLPAMLVPLCLTSIAPTLAVPKQSVQVAQSITEYDTYMRMGYVATAKRDYKNALVNFRKALDMRPDNPYAKGAIDNVSNYVASQGQSRLTFVTPNGLGAPESRQGGATRGAACPNEAKTVTPGAEPITALLPATKEGKTTSQYPELFVYLPQTSKTVEFALLNEKGDRIYVKDLAPSKNPGIVSLKLSSLGGVPPLEAGKTYQWFATIVCEPQDRSADIYTTGWIQRIEPDPALKSALSKATSSDRVSLTAVNGLWYDTLAALWETRQSSPNNSEVAAEWTDLLKSVGLEKFAKEPIVEVAAQ